MSLVKRFLPVVALTMLVACNNHSVIDEVPLSNGERFNGIIADKISIITDSETKCKYIYVESGLGNYKTTAMSPLYIASDTVDCR